MGNGVQYRAMILGSNGDTAKLELYRNGKPSGEIREARWNKGFKRWDVSGDTAAPFFPSKRRKVAMPRYTSDIDRTMRDKIKRQIAMLDEKRIRLHDLWRSNQATQRESEEI